MQAAVLNQVGDSDLELREDVGTTRPGPDEVRVRIRAAGICHSDLSAMDGTLPALAPGIIGHEGSGDVVEIGAAVTDLAVGDQVIISFVPPCGKCASCLRGEANLCSVHAIAAFSSPRFVVGDQPVFGFAGCGTFAEELVVPSAGAVRVDGDVPYEIAALIGCGVLTGVGAVLNTAKVEPGASVVIIGAGGVGIAAIQGARLSGATQIVAVDPVTDKHDLARGFGATHACTPEALPELIEKLTGNQGFDYAFEVVGQPATIRAAWDATRRGGTTVVVGAGRADATVEFSAQELFLHEKKLLGSFYGSADVRRDYRRMIELWQAGLLDLAGMISRRITLSEINDGLAGIRSGKFIRQIVTVD
ncbi:S-(hydroxymethyl)glutathione dehydrogenase/alcohol dehydrogenase [Tamaricihabitans halophyticus]|uniref:S-(Hydroxymethyl)glutathione dehydrogenase/alcohol dehydrogenase n=1 Tax=Tamaricihabitans halophyticus TaxID=1262583 RepID=A0A4R2QEB4_9PSEU|nr:Zn-dependent alcohol dehydrogenase [Tamaricihabitans halophyticus]TCP45381.1 S-(hydroxymethyl)glutathione dehydrogenase/alcohol dehydrogenase [Tamaricihabitans halophyticus]